mgnify:CR=1 FL=1
MSSSSNASSGGIGLCGFVFLIFLFLKLAEMGTVATWSWWWVTSPLWIPISLVLGIMAIALVFAGVVFLLAMIFGKKAQPARIRRMR